MSKIEKLKELLNYDSLDEQTIKDFLSRYKNDPVLFTKEVLGYTPDLNQINILNSVIKNKWNAVSASTGVGKTYASAFLALWFSSCYPNSKVIITANTYSQLKRNTWPTILKILKKSAVQTWFEDTAEKITNKFFPDTSFISIVANSKENPESLQGIHEKNVLFIIDEASGIEKIIFETIYGSCTERNNKVFAIGNPNRDSGEFYEIFNTERGKKWSKIHIDGFSSNFTDKDQLNQWIQEYGEDSDYVRIRVLGKFPRKSSTNIVSPTSLLNSFSKTPQFSDKDTKILSIDVSGGGDAMILSFRQGYGFHFIQPYKGDIKKIDTYILDLDSKHNFDYIVIDSTGHGFWFSSQFKKYPELLKKIIDVNFASQATESLRYANKRAEMYGLFQDYLDSDGSIPFNQDLQDQIIATEYHINAKGLIQLESKDSIKDKLNGTSPDTADSVALSFMVPKKHMFRIDRQNLETKINKAQHDLRFRNLQKSFNWEPGGY